MKIGAKLYTFIGGIVAIVFLVFGFYIYNLLKSDIDTSYQEAMQEYLCNYSEMIGLEIESKKKTEALAMKVASNYLKSFGNITEINEKTTVGEIVVNKWLIQNKQIQKNYEIVDYIKSLGVNTATIFQKTQKGYLRISTNVIGNDGERAIGTLIAFDSPVVQAIEKGETYIGRAWVVNAWYVTAYEPIRINGEIKGILYVGEPEINYNKLSAIFKEKQFFGSGYPYIVDNNGILTAHPKSVGLSIAEYDFFKEIQAKKNGEVNYVWEGKEKTQIFQHIEAIDSYISVGWYDEDYDAMFSKVRNVIIFAVFIALFIVLLTLLFIVRGIVNSLRKGVDAAESIANGKINVDLESELKDETGQLLSSMKRMAMTIKGLVEEMNSVANSAVEGDLKKRGNPAAFEGEFKEIINGFNSTLDAVINPLNVAADYIEKIGNGNIPPIITAEYKGDFNGIKESINMCLKTLNAMSSDVRLLCVASYEGQLKTRVDASLHSGIYGKIVAGLNDVLDNITTPLNMMTNYIDRISKGDIPPLLVTDDYRGDFTEVKNSVNRCINAVSLLIQDSKQLADAAANGELAARADASKHLGDFRQIIQGVNNTINNLVDPLNLAAQYVNLISKGEIPNKITDEYKGDYNTIKDSLNGCIDGLQGLVEAREILANVVVNNYTKDVTGKYLGIFLDIANSANAILTKLRGITALFKDIANGDLKEIDSLRKEGKRCEFDELNPSLLAMMDTIMQLVEETVFLANAGATGKLAVRGDQSKFKGEYINVIEGFNKTMDNIINPLGEAGKVLSIYASGDLTPRMTGDYQGDLAVYKDNVNTLGQALSDLIREVLDAVQATASAAIQISSTAETMAVAAEEQSKQSDEVAGAVEEMARTVTENAMNAGKAAELAEKNGTIANNGGLIVEQTVAKMCDIANVVKQSAINIEKLGDSSKEIGEIISVIDDIADQTNLLALNAAIEAARAGEQGRGFAVVADEVRKLAERTTDATKQIAGMIKGIQNETQIAVVAMHQGTNEVAEGIQLADKAGESLKSVVDSSRLVQDMINQIAAASEQQSSTSEQVAQNVGMISHVTNDSARRIQDIAHSSEDLSKLTEQLRVLVSRFNIDADEVFVQASYNQLAPFENLKKHLTD